MDFLTGLRHCLVAAGLIAAGLSTETAFAGDFINVSGVGSKSIPEAVYQSVPAPWSEASFKEKFPDVGFLPDVRVELIPLVEPEPGTGPAGAGGKHHMNAKATAAGIRAPKITIKHRPGF